MSISLPIGFICTNEYCFEKLGLGDCSGTHHLCFSEPDDGLAPIMVDGSVQYISLRGFRIYYTRQLRHANQSIYSFRFTHKEIGEPPAKKRRLR